MQSCCIPGGGKGGNNLTVTREISDKINTSKSLILECETKKTLSACLVIGDVSSLWMMFTVRIMLSQILGHVPVSILHSHPPLIGYLFRCTVTRFGIRICLSWMNYQHKILKSSESLSFVSIAVNSQNQVQRITTKNYHQNWTIHSSHGIDDSQYKLKTTDLHALTGINSLQSNLR